MLVVSFMLLSATSALGGDKTVAVLAGHSPTSWDKGNCTSSSRALADCNLKIYEQAVITAKQSGAQLLVFPEGYGLVPKHDFFEPLASFVGQTPCDIDGANVTSPQQHALSCMAAAHSIALSTNVFVALSNKTNRIMSIVFNESGAVVTTYSKHHVVPIAESPWATPGPFAPTTFSLLGHKWGLVICYEGVWPSLPGGNWDQMDALKAQGAEAFIWSVGGDVPLAAFGEKMAKKYQVQMLISSDTSAIDPVHTGVLLGADGQPLASQKDVVIAAPADYTNKHLAVRVAVM